MAQKFVVWDDTTGRYKRSTTAASAIPDYRAGQQAVSLNATSVSVTFSSAIANTSYAVICSWINTTDGSPQFQPINVTAFSTSGFTASWNAPADSANYSINWYVVANQ